MQNYYYYILIDIIESRALESYLRVNFIGSKQIILEQTEEENEKSWGELSFLIVDLKICPFIGGKYLNYSFCELRNFTAQSLTKRNKNHENLVYFE